MARPLRDALDLSAEQRESRPGDRLLPGADWLALPVDLLVPAAMSYVIPLHAVDRVKARVVVEGANLPTLPDAEAALAERGIPVLPGFLANLGTNAWWYWVIFGDIEPTPASSFAKLSATMRRLVDTVKDAAERDRVTLRTAATVLAERNADALTGEFG
ncbi:MAG: hypothetical protein L0Y54_14565 [Sporichthyaceae bacterium]|nr:hypothetical protein [Sporichthyaceae bacterium]